jgi:hypothetical protein
MTIHRPIPHPSDKGRGEYSPTNPTLRDVCVPSGWFSRAMTE